MSIALKPAALTACLALAAGGGGAAVLTASAGASTVPTRAAAAHKHKADVHQGTGSLTVTGVRGKTHTRNDVKVDCRVVNGRYVVSSGGKRHRDRLGSAQILQLEADESEGRAVPEQDVAERLPRGRLVDHGCGIEASHDAGEFRTATCVTIRDRDPCGRPPLLNLHDARPSHPSP